MKNRVILVENSHTRWRATVRAGVRLLTALIFPGLAADARGRDREPEWFVLNTWTAREGVPQGTVLASLRTRDGYLWIATKGGVARFDGIRFAVYDDRDRKLRDNEVTALAEGDDSSLWIGTLGGVTRFKDGQFTTYTVRDGLANDFVTTLCKDATGGIWVGTDNGLSRFHQGRFTNYTASNGLAHNAITALYGDGAGNVWIGDVEGVLTRFKNGQFSSHALEGAEPGVRIRAICSDRDGALWIARAGLYRLKEGTSIRYTTKDGLSSDQAACLHLDLAGNLWIGSNRGLDRYQDGKFFPCTEVSGKSIISISSDWEGCVWVGGGGFHCLREGPFVRYTAKEGLSYHYMTSVLEDRAGNIWIGAGRGLNCFKNGQFKVFAAGHGLPEALIGALAEDREGFLWVATDIGVYRSESSLANSAGSLELRFALVKDPSLPNLRPRALYVDREGAIWIGAIRDGLGRYKDKRFTLYTVQDGLLNNAIRGICEDQEGNLWIGTHGGLNRFKDGKFFAYTEKDGLVNNTVEGLYLDRDHTLWIATRQGVNRFKDGRFTTYTSKDGLFSSYVYNFVEDDHGNLWMNCSRGIFRVGKQQLHDFADGKITSVSSIAYGREHGLSSISASGGYGHASYKSRDGRVWFAMASGLSMVDPKRVLTSAPPPAVHIEEVRIDRRGYPVNQTAAASPGRGDLVFRYTGINFLAPEKVRFKHQLVGHDSEWIDAEDRRIAFYNNIEPGHYTFRILAANNEGIWNNTGASFAFYLQPHWYQTWVFRMSVAVLLALLAMGVYQLRVRQMQQRQYELEHRVAERTAQLEAANKELEAFSYSVSHDLRAPLRGIDGFSKAVLDENSAQLDAEGQANLERVRQASQRMESLIDDMLKLSTISRTEMTCTTVDLTTMARNIIRELHATEPERQVQFVIASDLKAKADPNLIRIALENLLRNAWKYTSKHPTARIELGLKQQNGHAVYFVRDDGAGFDMAFARKLFGAFQRLHPAMQFQGTGVGLATVQRIIHRHGGQVWAEAAIEQGATFYFTIPGN